MTSIRLDKISKFFIENKLISAACFIVLFSIVRISWHGFDFVSDQLPTSQFCEQDIGSAMERGGHQEELLWRGCLVASDTQNYMKRYIKINDIFNTHDRKMNQQSCLSCHDGDKAPTFATMWTYFPRFNVKKNRLEDFAQAVKDEIQLRYGGTRPDRYDILISTLYNYAFTKAKMQGLSFIMDKNNEPVITQTKLTELKVTKKCLEIFEKHGGLPRGQNASSVVKGCNLITDTPNHVPKLLTMWRTDMKCQSCHRDGGTKPYAAPLAFGAVLLPIISTRAYKPIRFHRRVLMCFARSLNWLDLGRDSPLPTQIRIYANWLAQKQNLKIGVIYPGRGIPMIYDTAGLGSSILAGEKVFKKTCRVCHGENAWGGTTIRVNGEQPPPIAGPNSFNGTATTSRRPRLAGFIYNNMPPGATHDNPVLTIQESLDVSLYLQSLGRPSDFVHNNQVKTFFNYIWQNTIYYSYNLLKIINSPEERQKPIVTKDTAELVVSSHTSRTRK